MPSVPGPPAFTRWNIRVRSTVCSGSTGLGRTDRLILRANAANDILREFTFYLDAWAGEALFKSGLPALAVQHVDLSRTIVPFDFQILEEGLGRPLDQFNDDEPRMRRLLRELGRFVAQIHSISLPGYGLLDARPLASGAGPPRGMVRHVGGVRPAESRGTC